MSHNSDCSPTPMAEQQEQSPIRPSFISINRKESSSEDEPAEGITSEGDMSPDNEEKGQAVDTPVNEDNLATSTMTKPSIIKLGKRKRLDHITDKPVNTRTLQRASFPGSSPQPEESASPLRGGGGKTARHKRPVMKASLKPTCMQVLHSNHARTIHRHWPRKQPPDPAKAQIRLLNSVISLSNPAATEIKFLAEKYQANFNNIGDLETHEFRSMSRLLWLTHLELKDRLREVQGLDREVQGLKREREDWRRERKKIMRALGRMSEIDGNSPAGSSEGDEESATPEQ